jgi:hypothetical protein
MTVLRAAPQVVIRRARPEAAAGVLTMMFSHPGSYWVVAKVNGWIAGSNCLDERSAMAGVGPITVDPTAQNKGIGRALMIAVMERASEAGSPGRGWCRRRFTIARFRSMPAWASMCASRSRACRGDPGVRVSRMQDAGAQAADACNALSQRVHEFDRGGELSDAPAHGGAVVVERGERITGCSSAPAFFGHSTAESFGGQWCFANCLRTVQPMTLASTGE